MSSRKDLMLEIKNICDALSQSIVKHLDLEATGEIVTAIKLLQSKLDLFLTGLE